MSRKIHEVSVKALCRDETGRVLVIRDAKDRWELPGGGLEAGEELLDCLRREVMEELGVDCELLDPDPYKAWVGKKASGDYRLIILYKVRLKDTEFKKTDEAQEVRFVTREELQVINLVPQIEKIKQIL
jgi:8-oxo-dGTP pyrophosphatase MutT (NUDIX family)